MQLQRYVQRLPRTTSAQRAQWVQKFHSSGLSREAFAREHGLRRSTFHRWVAQSTEPLESKPKNIAFQEVRLSAAPRTSAQDWAMEVLTPAGLIVRLR